MTLIRFFVEGYECTFAQVEIDKNEFYPIPHIGDEVVSLSDEIIVLYPDNHEGKENDKIDFDFYHVENVSYSLAGNNNDEDFNLVDIVLKGDYYDFD